MKVIQRFFLERKLLRIWLLESKVQEAASFKELALVRIEIFNRLWDREIPHGTLKGKIMNFQLPKVGTQKPSLDDKKIHLLLILSEFKQAYEKKLLKIS